MRHLNTDLIGTSAEMAELREEIDRISLSDAKVLVTGESGVGKELVARAIHDGADRGHASPSCRSTAPASPRRSSNRSCSAT